MKLPMRVYFHHPRTAKHGRQRPERTDPPNGAHASRAAPRVPRVLRRFTAGSPRVLLHAAGKKYECLQNDSGRDHGKCNSETYPRTQTKHGKPTKNDMNDEIQ